MMKNSDKAGFLQELYGLFLKETMLYRHLGLPGLQTFLWISRGKVLKADTSSIQVLP